MMDKISKQILNFWFSEESQPFWFAKDDKFDETIIQQFGKVYEDVAARFDDQFLEEIKSGQDALACVILLDQFPRNMFRGSPKAFATDDKALALSKWAIEKGLNQELKTTSEHNFLYMPFMHSEILEDQEEGIRLFSLIPGNDNAISYAQQHRDIIIQFGRFPHRNKVLGRDSTPEEVEFDKAHGGF